ncbi:MAG: hypothetical protein RIC14_13080 [Filomicrobium sp.]
MKLGYLLWVLAVAIAILVGISKFAGIDVPVVTSMLMQDSTLSLFVALGLSLVAKWV